MSLRITQELVGKSDILAWKYHMQAIKWLMYKTEAKTLIIILKE